MKICTILLTVCSRRLLGDTARLFVSSHKVLVYLSHHSIAKKPEKPIGLQPLTRNTNKFFSDASRPLHVSTVTETEFDSQ